METPFDPCHQGEIVNAQNVGARPRKDMKLQSLMSNLTVQSHSTGLLQDFTNNWRRIKNYSSGIATRLVLQNIENNIILLQRPNNSPKGSNCCPWLHRTTVQAVDLLGLSSDGRVAG